VVAFEDAPFVPVMADRPDAGAIAVLWGDPNSGPSAMFIRLPKGALPMHSHSSDYHLLVLKGVAKHWSEGQTEAAAKPLGPGSYWFQHGNEVHGDSCLSDECVLHIVWAGKRDGKLAEPAK
jgi:quercetin dioxygenase-like cupin family protein